jgi:hypothetical protein
MNKRIGFMNKCMDFMNIRKNLNHKNRVKRGDFWQEMLEKTSCFGKIPMEYSEKLHYTLGNCSTEKTLIPVLIKFGKLAIQRA